MVCVGFERSSAEEGGMDRRVCESRGEVRWKG